MNIHRHLWMALGLDIIYGCPLPMHGPPPCIQFKLRISDIYHRAWKWLQPYDEMHHWNRSTFPLRYPLVMKNHKKDFHFDDIRLRYMAKPIFLYSNLETTWKLKKCTIHQILTIFMILTSRFESTFIFSFRRQPAEIWQKKILKLMHQGTL